MWERSERRLIPVPAGPCGSAKRTADRQAYLEAVPWPHLVLDGLFDPALVAAAEAEQLEVARSLSLHTSRRQIKAERSLVVGPASEQLMGVLDSAHWVTFLEELTGVPGLEHDESHFWAGLHVGPVGAFQAVHRDFQKHPATGLFHRVNVLLYLSSGWTEDEGGELEMWTRDTERCARSVLPVAGRLVVFETHAETPHAVARQTSPDPGRVRLALAAYYYSRQPPAIGVRRLGTLFQPRPPGEPWTTSLIAALDAVRGLRRRLAVVPARAGHLIHKPGLIRRAAGTSSYPGRPHRAPG
jgi:Rps23 Pro-64 3,4-dihydroxylase Tpa1-like proline 4-hydroxylase